MNKRARTKLDVDSSSCVEENEVTPIPPLVLDQGEPDTIVNTETFPETYTEQINRLKEQSKETEDKTAALSKERDDALSEVKRLMKENAEVKNEYSKLKLRVLCLENIDDDESICFFTGFPDIHIFEEVFKYLNSVENGENIQYYLSKEQNLGEEFHASQPNAGTRNKR